MLFSALDIRKAPTLRKEVGKVLQKFHHAQSIGDVEAFHSISSEIVEQIRELEDFSLLHSTDERVVLFEKQSLRLQAALAPDAAPEGHEGHENTSSDNSTPKPFRAGGHRRISLISSPPNDMKSAPNSLQKKKSKKALYAWEKGTTAVDTNAKDAQALIDNILERQGYRVNDNLPGHFVLPPHLIDTDGRDSTSFDVQFILTAEEQKELIKRRRAQKAYLDHFSRNEVTRNKSAQIAVAKSKGSSLMSQAPYLDPKRNQDSQFRASKKERWVDGKRWE